MSILRMTAVTELASMVMKGRAIRVTGFLFLWFGGRWLMQVLTALLMVTVL